VPLAQPVCRTSPSGFLVALEGGDGAGKSTQLGLLVRRLTSTGREVVATREPGGTPVGAAIREVLLHGDDVAPRAEALLFAADRAHHVGTVVAPALERGAVVVTDRFMDSSIAYQSVARGLQAEDVRSLSLWATGGLLPHLTVVLDVAPGIGRARRRDRADRLEAEDEAFHQRVRQGFRDLAATAPERYLVVDGAADPRDVHHTIVDRLHRMRPDLLPDHAEGHL
jgi:dTMP kinase